MSPDDIDGGSDIERAQRLQDNLVSFATGRGFEGEDPVYQALRRSFVERADLRDKVPDFVQRFRNLSQFWQFIKIERGGYAERRVYIWNAFQPLLVYLETSDRAPGLQPIEDTLKRFDPEHIVGAWQKALDRRANDPDGAITAARALLESVCKHILDDAQIEYAADEDLPKLWALCAELMNLAPSQHEEKVFKAILGNCQSVVGSLAAIRNKVGDAHGTGRRAVKPKPRHAELAVNLAGTMASFLIATWMEQAEARAA